ncbi:glycoside hydrolase family 13 protein [Lachnospiraceae bacterium 42-17]
MREQALFNDGTADYVIPQEPNQNETVTLRFRTAKGDVSRVRLITAGCGYDMDKDYSQGEFDYYKIRWRLGKNPFRYYFEIQSKDEVCYYNRCGVSKKVIEYYDFVLVPGFSTPEWAKGAVMYQIYTDRFYNGDASNDVETNEYYYIGGYSRRVDDWNKYPDNMGVREFYGGDLKGVIDKLDYLQELGVEVLYFNPLFVSPSNHKYDIQDYDYIDPHFGVIVEDGGEVLRDGDTENVRATKYQIRTGDIRNLEASNQLFIRLVEELHERGMKIILDGVFNHCGSFNKWMDRERVYENQEAYAPGAYISADSPYHNYFLFYDNDVNRWPYNSMYDGWWGHDTLPKLNYEDSIELEEYILQVGRKWVSPPFNADGWRLDVAADLGRSNEYNHDFWKKFRRAVKEANPNAIILAEHYGDPREWLQGDEWDTVMNYDAFMEPVTWFLTGMEKHSDESRDELMGNTDHFAKSISHHMANMLTPSLQVAMNELSNHDHSRFLTRTNHMVGRAEYLGSRAAEEYVNEAVMREAVVMQMTWVGAPTIYYGDEAGVCGFTDPDNRRTYPWGNENQELLSFHREMIHIHKSYQALRTGSIKILAWSEKNILAYGRFTDREKIVVIVNNNNELREVRVSVWEAGVPLNGRMERLIYTYDGGYKTEYEEFLVQDGNVVVNMNAYSALVLVAVGDGVF